jgi:hypothetical protein
VTAITDLSIRKLITIREEVLTEGGRADAGAPLM